MDLYFPPASGSSKRIDCSARSRTRHRSGPVQRHHAFSFFFSGIFLNPRVQARTVPKPRPLIRPCMSDDQPMKKKNIRCVSSTRVRGRRPVRPFSQDGEDNWRVHSSTAIDGVARHLRSRLGVSSSLLEPRGGGGGIGGRRIPTRPSVLLRRPGTVCHHHLHLCPDYCATFSVSIDTGRRFELTRT